MHHMSVHTQIGDGSLVGLACHFGSRILGLTGPHRGLGPGSCCYLLLIVVFLLLVMAAAGALASCASDAELTLEQVATMLSGVIAPGCGGHCLMVVRAGRDGQGPDWSPPAPGEQSGSGPERDQASLHLGLLQPKPPMVDGRLPLLWG